MLLAQPLQLASRLLVGDGALALGVGLGRRQRPARLLQLRLQLPRAFLRQAGALAQLPRRLRVHLAHLGQLLVAAAYLGARGRQLVLEDRGPRPSRRSPLARRDGRLAARVPVRRCVRKRQLHGQVRAHGQLRVVERRALAGPGERRDPLLAVLGSPRLVVQHGEHAPPLAPHLHVQRRPQEAMAAQSEPAPDDLEPVVRCPLEALDVERHTGSGGRRRAHRPLSIPPSTGSATPVM